MIIDINPILKGEKTELEIGFDLEITEELDDIRFPDTFPVKGKVKDMAGYITLKLEADVKYTTACARCLVPITEQKNIVFEKTVVTNSIELQNEDNDDYITANDGYIDADEALIEQIVLELPLRHLCKEDCKGLCPVCGIDLNTDTCSCETKEADPRFDILRKLLEDNKKN